MLEIESGENRATVLRSGVKYQKLLIIFDITIKSTQVLLVGLHQSQGNNAQHKFIGHSWCLNTVSFRSEHNTTTIFSPYSFCYDCIMFVLNTKTERIYACKNFSLKYYKFFSSSLMPHTSCWIFLFSTVFRLVITITANINFEDFINLVCLFWQNNNNNKTYFIAFKIIIVSNTMTSKFYVFAWQRAQFIMFASSLKLRPT